MKLLTLNFLTCARKTCKSSPDSFPLRPRSAELERLDVAFSGALLTNLLPRLDWPALLTICHDLGLEGLPEEKPEAAEMVVQGEGGEEASPLARDIHRLLLETGVKEGKLVCANCEHPYEVKEGIANFLLPAHMV